MDIINPQCITNLNDYPNVTEIQLTRNDRQSQLYVLHVQKDIMFQLGNTHTYTLCQMTLQKSTFLLGFPPYTPNKNQIPNTGAEPIHVFVY